jgi:predicted phage-related endonuclease
VSTWTTPGAKRVLGANASRAAVADVLHHRMSSFDADAVADTNPYTGALGMWERKTANQPPALTPAQVATADATPRLIAEFEARHPGITTRRVGVLVSRTLDWLAARPTALCSTGSLLIVTTTREELGHEWHSPLLPEHQRMPARIATRVLHDLMVTGATHAYVLCEVQGYTASEIVLRSVSRDEPGVQDAIDALFTTEETFWVRHVLHRQAPAPTAGDKDMLVKRHRIGEQDAPMVATPDQMADLLLRAQLKEQIRDLTRQVQAIDAALMGAMGDKAGSLIAPPELTDPRDQAKGKPTVLLRWANNNGFASADFAADYPEEAARFRYFETKVALDHIALALAEPELARPYFNRPFTPAVSGAAMTVLDVLVPTPRTATNTYLRTLAAT